MANLTLAAVNRLAHALAASEEPVSDTELLRRFADQQDEAAFRALVERHGRMVLGLCRRLLGPADAEDAFQATFLVLVQKGARLRNPGRLASWLFGVAYRTCLMVRCDQARRRIKEQEAGVMSARSGARADLDQADLADDKRLLIAALQEEVNRLPDRYRAPLVLCCLENKSRAEAARLLGWPQGTVASRLARARDLLSKRLTRCGLVLSAASFAGILEEFGRAPAVSAALAKETFTSALNLLNGGTVAVNVAALAQGVKFLMMLNKIKAAICFLAPLSLLLSWTAVSMVSVLSVRSEAAPAQKQAADDKLDPAEKKADAAPMGDALPENALARLGKSRWRHNLPVIFTSYASKGKLLVTGTADGQFHVWDAQSGKKLRQFGEGAEGVNSAVYMRFAELSPDGETLAHLGVDGEPRLWSLQTGKRVKPREPKKLDKDTTASSPGLKFSPDGTLLAACGPNQIVRVLEVATGKEIAQIPANPKRAQAALAFVAKGDSLLTLETVNGGTLLRLFDPRTGKEQRAYDAPEKTSFFNGALLSPDCEMMAAMGPSGIIVLFDAETGREIRQLGNPKPGAYYILQFSPNGKVLAAKDNNRQTGITFWNVATGEEIATIPDAWGPGAPPLRGMAFSPDGKTLADATMANAMRFFELSADGDTAHKPKQIHDDGVNGAIRQLALSPDGKTLTTYSSDQRIVQWDMAAGVVKNRLLLPASTKTCVLDREGHTAACLVDKLRVQLWNLKTGKELGSISLEDKAKELERLENKDPRLKGVSASILAQPDNVALALSQDGKSLAINTFDRAVEIFDVATRTRKHDLKGPKDDPDLPNGGLYYRYLPVRIALSANGRKAAFFFAGMGVLWDVESEMPRAFKASAGIIDVAFSANGRYVALVTADEFATVYELPTGGELIESDVLFRARLPAENLVRPVKEGRPGRGPAPIQNAWQEACWALSNDGLFLAIGGMKPRVWDLEHGKELAKLPGHDASVTGLLFSTDGKRLLTGSADTTALVWDFEKLAPASKRPSGEWTEKQQDAWWKALAGEPADALKAMAALRADPKQALAFLKARVKPIAPVAKDTVRKLIDDLSSSDFKTRQRATMKIEEIDDLALVALKETMAENPPLEVQRRIEQLLQRINRSSSLRRGLRALALLEDIAAPEANELVRAVAAGDPGHRLTHEAGAAMKRMNKTP